MTRCATRCISPPTTSARRLTPLPPVLCRAAPEAAAAVVPLSLRASGLKPGTGDAADELYDDAADGLVRDHARAQPAPLRSPAALLRAAECVPTIRTLRQKRACVHFRLSTPTPRRRAPCRRRRRRCTRLAHSEPQPPPLSRTRRGLRPNGKGARPTPFSAAPAASRRSASTASGARERLRTLVRLLLLSPALRRHRYSH